MDTTDNIISTIHTAIVTSAPRLGLTPESAADLANSVVELVCHHHATERPYIPATPRTHRQQQRRAAIAAHNEGKRIPEIAATLGKTERTIRSWLKKQ